MGITDQKEVRGWTVNQLIQCDHLAVTRLECSSTSLAAIVVGQHSIALVVEGGKAKVLCLACFKKGLEHRLDVIAAN